jgi:hypothetical protein
MTPEEQIVVRRRLGRLSDKLVQMQPRQITRDLLDEIVMTLRAGEKVLFGSRAESVAPPVEGPESE